MHNAKRSVALLVLGSMVAWNSAAATQDGASPPRAKQAPPPAGARPTLEQFFKIRAPGSPTLRDDGTLYVIDWPDGINQLYKRSAGAGVDAPMTKLTHYEDGINGYSLSPDGKTIIFAAAIGGSEQNDLYKLDTVTDEITPLRVDPNVVSALQVWLADSSGFIYTENDTSPADFHIYRYDFASGQTTKLLERQGNWDASDITDDGSRLLVSQFISASHIDSYELDVATGELTPLNVGPKETVNAVGSYLPGFDKVTIVSDKEDGIARLFVRDLKTGEVIKPLPDLDPYDFEGGDINESRDLAAVSFNDGGYATMRLVSLPDFKTLPLPPIEKGLVGSVNLRDRTLTWTQSNSRNAGLAYAYDVPSAGSGSSASTQGARQITTADTQGIDLSKFPLQELVEFESFDGLKVPAFLFTPPGYVKGKAIPFVVNYHGGPEGQSRPGFNRTVQYLLARGYGVLMPNVRGSTGYGREFQMMDNYKKRWDSVKDGVEAARWLVKNGYAEPGRIAAYGGSYGGFMAVATIIEGGDVFGASIDVVGIVNFKTFLEQTKDYRRKLREAEYGPLDDPEFLASVSPLHRIDEIKVPMLIAHGLNDPRVPVGEAMQLAVELQKRGYDPELLFFPDEGHGFAKLENRLLFYDRMEKFLDQTIRN
jgi:dipeptidyl aminopeptidase/acylaminoacyl peptidase